VSINQLASIWHLSTISLQSAGLAIDLIDLCVGTNQEKNLQGFQERKCKDFQFPNNRAANAAKNKTCCATRTSE
jgi:hypothetical protein